MNKCIIIEVYVKNDKMIKILKTLHIIIGLLLYIIPLILILSMKSMEVNDYYTSTLIRDSFLISLGFIPFSILYLMTPNLNSVIIVSILSPVILIFVQDSETYRSRDLFVLISKPFLCSFFMCFVGILLIFVHSCSKFTKKFDKYDIE